MLQRPRQPFRRSWHLPAAPAECRNPRRQFRRAWNTAEEKWYFAIDDVVLALTDSANVKDYIKKLRRRDPELDSYWETNCPLVEMTAADGKNRKIKAADTESLLRIIQSIPSHPLREKSQSEAG